MQPTRLILHFQADLLRLPTHPHPAQHLCSKWIWGTLQHDNKEDPAQVTGWLQQTNILTSKPQEGLVTYDQYLRELLKPSTEEESKLLLQLAEAAGSKCKPQIDRCVRNSTLPKLLGESVKAVSDPDSPLLAHYNSTQRYHILPAFFKLLLSLKKNKRDFCIVIKNPSGSDNHLAIIQELNLFFSGQHPLYNGRNGTPLVKWDGSNSTRNFIIEEAQQCVLYSLGEGELFATFGTLDATEERDAEMFKQKFKNFKHVRLCEGAQEIHSLAHALLPRSSCLYEVNPLHALILDPSDARTHDIFFTTARPAVYDLTGKRVEDTQHSFVVVDQCEYLQDVDYFIKQVEAVSSSRIEMGRSEGERRARTEAESQRAKSEQEERLSNYEYLQQQLFPVLEAAFRQVDLLRPQDPVAFVALYCLKNQALQ